MDSTPFFLRKQQNDEWYFFLDIFSGPSDWGYTPGYGGHEKGDNRGQGHGWHICGYGRSQVTKKGITKRNSIRKRRLGKCHWQNASMQPSKEQNAS